MSTSEIAERFRLKTLPTLRSSMPPRARITISRVRCDESEHGASRSPPVEDAYAASIAIADLVSADVQLHGRTVKRGGAPASGLYLFNLSSDPIVFFHSPFDFVRFYISRSALDELSRDAGALLPGSLTRPDFGALDPILFNLALAMLPALERPDEPNQLFVDHVALAFHAHLVLNYAGPCRDVTRSRAGLAPWQTKLATEMIASRLDGKLSIAELATACALSQSHFSRAFLHTLGVPPHRWLLDRRVDRAKELITGGDMPLADVARACGFANQSHFTRVFVGLTGMPPGKWRRMRHRLDAFERPA
ncbi:MAG: AraC family transcriptional regulator [Luteibacter sp.]